jgi:hypothetical protein
VTLEPGKTHYRDVGHGSFPNGSFWTEAPPASEGELRSSLAVLNRWNGNHGVVSFTPSRPVLAWEGEVAPQWATGEDGFDGNDGAWMISPAPEGGTP